MAITKEEMRGLGDFEGAFDEAVKGDKELGEAFSGDKMRDDSADVVTEPKPSERVATLREAAEKARAADDAEFGKSFNETPDSKPVEQSKPEFSTFSEAFRWHRKNTPGENFEFKGKWYTTEMAPKKERLEVKGDVNYGNEGRGKPAPKPQAKSIYDTSRDPLVAKAKSMVASVSKGMSGKAEMPEPVKRTQSGPTEKSKPLSTSGVDPKTLLPKG